MSLDLYNREISERLSQFGGTQEIAPGAFDGFLRGTGMLAMRGLAQGGRSIDMAGAVFPMLQDAISGGTEAQDRYFKEHDEVFGRAVDAWTPKPLEVGVAAEVVGGLLGQLPLVIASPHLAVGAQVMSTAEDLARAGVSGTRAAAAGVVQGAGLATGIWMPILGQTLAQRVLLGGAGFNLLQGIGTRGASQLILEGTPGEKSFDALDAKAMTLDVLLGMAFGTLAHLSPEQRAQGAEMWKRIGGWMQKQSPSSVAALATLRTAQHLNQDSLPGRPVEPSDIEAHVARARAAIDALASDRPVEVSDLPAARTEADPARFTEAARRGEALAKTGEQLARTENLEIGEPALRITPNTGLSPEFRVIESRFARQILGDLDGAIAAYDKLPDSAGGKIINTDVARELSPDYAASMESRARLSAAVHEPASALVKEIYARKLAEPDPTGLNMVTFTAGGTGAGKTTAISGVPIASEIQKVSQIVYDTNMNSTPSAISKIDMALAAGKQVNILFVGRDPVEALVGGALPRAQHRGRTVPLAEHEATHVGAARTIAELEAHYAGNDKVQFVFLDNGGGRGQAKIVGSSAELLKNYDFDNLGARLKEALDNEHQAGRISDLVYEGTAGARPEVEGAVPGRTGEAGAQRQHPEAGQTPGQAEEVAGRTPAARLPETEGLAAKGGGAEPPPPRGDSAPSGQPGGPTPLELEAHSMAAERGDLPMIIGTNTDGTPITKSVREYLADVAADVEQARQDAGLFKVAAACLMGVA